MLKQSDTTEKNLTLFFYIFIRMFTTRNSTNKSYSKPFCSRQFMKKYICYIVIIILSFSVFSCSQQNTGRNSQTSIDNNFEKQKHSQSFTSNIISFPCAIILTPTSKFIDSLKKTDAENLKIELEEIISYHNEAQEYFNSHQIKII